MLRGRGIVELTDSGDAFPQGRVMGVRPETKETRLLEGARPISAPLGAAL
jgi:hypothetical protein